MKEGRRDAPRAWQPEAATAPTPTVDLSPPEVQAAPPAARPPEPEPSAEPVVTTVPLTAPIQPATVETAATPSRRFVRVFDAPVHATGTPEHHASELSAVERMLGAEQLTVLRARHAEILARISARGGDPARVEALREQAAAVDPDGWVTEADVTAGLASVDTTLAELHRIVGRRRRRRRRRRVEGPVAPPAGDCGASASESLDQADADDELELDTDAEGPADD